MARKKMMLRSEGVAAVDSTITSSSSSSNNVRIHVSYGECQRNLALEVGGYALDGCREFMATAEGALVCAACGCHRSFHRRIVESEADAV